jgi:hypothetical protein
LDNEDPQVALRGHDYAHIRGRQRRPKYPAGELPPAGVLPFQLRNTVGQEPGTTEPSVWGKRDPSTYKRGRSITVTPEEAQRARAKANRPEREGLVMCQNCGKKFRKVSTYQQHMLGRRYGETCPTPRELRRAGWCKDTGGFWCREGRSIAKVS